MTKPPAIPDKVNSIYQSWPGKPRKQALLIRKLVYQWAGETPVEETLKWGEPSYLARKGSTLRVGWKESTPDNLYLYFHCQSKLVDTFREVYGEQLEFEGNRAIVLDSNEKLPQQTLKHCIALTLEYHNIKHLPLLGA